MFAEKIMKKVSLLVGIQATFVLMLLALLCTTAAAQTTGTILGQVTDPSGAAVPNAAVEAENVGTGLTRSGVTDSLGSYAIPSLPLGAYKVSVKASGFKTFVQTGITLQLNQNARVDAQLALGTATETVNVEAEAVKVDTATASLGATMSTRQIADLPLDGRNALRLLLFLPGVSTANVQTIVTMGRGGPSFNISGQRSSANSMLLDGSVIGAAMTNFGANLPNPDALEEFRVLRNSYSAEYGRAEGSIILTVTKSGTNDYHGNVYEFLRNDALNGRNFFASGKPTLRQNQFGASLGGPVILPGYNGKDRTFFFFNYEGLRIRQKTINTGYPPTAAERAGDFSASATPVINPTTGLQYPGNIIPTTDLDPLALGILQYLPLPNQAGGFLSEVRPISQAVNQFNLKVDQQLGASDRFSFRWYRNQTKNYRDYGSISDILVRPTKDNWKSFSGTYTHVFSPGLLNELHGSYTRWQYFGQGAPAAKNPKDLGGVFNVAGSYPQVPWMFHPRFGFTPGFPFEESDTYWQADEKLTWMRGRHRVTGGLRWMMVRHTNDAQVFTSGAFYFDGRFTGNAMADYMIGRPYYLLHYSTIIDQGKVFEYQPFVQDDIKVTRKLTLNLGVRYELNPPWFQRNHRNSTHRFGYQSTVFPDAPPGLAADGDPGIPKGMYPTDKNNFAPRFGLAWDPKGDGKTAIRLGYGIFFENIGENPTALGTNNEPFILTLATAPYSFSNPYFGKPDPMPYDFSVGHRFGYPFELQAMSPLIRSGYSEQFNLSVQHQFAQDFVATVAYVGIMGHKLPQSREFNTAVYGPGATAANIQARRPYFNQYYAGIAYIYSDANANYHSLQAELLKRWSKGYSLQAAYTYSKTIDDSSTSSTPGAGVVQDPNNYRSGNRARSDMDQRHILSVNGIWDLPFLRNRGALTSAFGGWQLNVMERITTGIPFNVVSGVDRALIGSGRVVGPQRPDLVGNPNLDPNRAHGELVAAYFDKAAFALPALGTFGSLGRNALIGPGFAKTDMGIIKRFSLGKERLGKIQFRAEIFNLFNNVNFANPVANRLSPAFGKIQTAYDARIAQFGLKWEF